MVHFFTSISRFTMIFLLAIFTYDSFAALRPKTTERARRSRYVRQTVFMYLILINGNLVIYLNTKELRVLFMLAFECVLFAIVLLVFRAAYDGSNKPLVNSMAMLMAIGFIIITRLNIDKAEKQLFFAAVGMIVTALVPLIIKHGAFLSKLTWFYAVLGVGLLGIVLVGGSTVYGAKLNISIGGFTIQPSEFVKILFVFFVSCMFAEATDTRQVLITTAVAALHVLILIASKDLGSAGIFMITYLIMLYVATKNPRWLAVGALLCVLGLILAYFLFSHVRTRFLAWKDPISVVDGAGYQVSQSLFAIGTGGWFGSGLCQGMPDKIPLAVSDIVFASIAEEMGGVFALLVIFLCIGVFLLFLNSAMQISDFFYKLLALGLGTCYGAQTFIMIGGVTKFIPSTGVTLPLVSYGGSSLLSTMIIFAIIQGLYVREYQGEEDEYGEQE